MLPRSSVFLLAFFFPAFVLSFAPSCDVQRQTSIGILPTKTLTTLNIFKTDEDTKTKDMISSEEADQNDPKAKMKQLMKPITDAGVAGAISLFLWEAAFWILSIPTCSILYYQTTGSWPDWSNKEDIGKVLGEAVIFANIARFALPARIGLAITTTPWVQENIVDRLELFQNFKENEN